MSMVRTLDKQDLDMLMNRYPGIAISITRIISQRMSETPACCGAGQGIRLHRWKQRRGAANRRQSQKRRVANAAALANGTAVCPAAPSFALSC